MEPKRWYAIKRGYKTGIYNGTWSAVRKYVDYYSGAIFKGFDVYHEAYDYMHNGEELPPPVKQAQPIKQKSKPNVKKAVKKTAPVVAKKTIKPVIKKVVTKPVENNPKTIIVKPVEKTITKTQLINDPTLAKKVQELEKSDMEKDKQLSLLQAKIDELLKAQENNKTPVAKKPKPEAAPAAPKMESTADFVTRVTGYRHTNDMVHKSALHTATWKSTFPYNNSQTQDLGDFYGQERLNIIEKLAVTIKIIDPETKEETIVHDKINLLHEEKNVRGKLIDDSKEGEVVINTTHENYEPNKSFELNKRTVRGVLTLHGARPVVSNDDIGIMPNEKKDSLFHTMHRKGNMAKGIVNVAIGLDVPILMDHYTSKNQHIKKDGRFLPHFVDNGFSEEESKEIEKAYNHYNNTNFNTLEEERDDENEGGNCIYKFSSGLLHQKVRNYFIDNLDKHVEQEGQKEYNGFFPIAVVRRPGENEGGTHIQYSTKTNFNTEEEAEYAFNKEGVKIQVSYHIMKKMGADMNGDAGSLRPINHRQANYNRLLHDLVDNNKFSDKEAVKNLLRFSTHHGKFYGKDEKEIEENLKASGEEYLKYTNTLYDLLKTNFHGKKIQEMKEGIIDPDYKDKGKIWNVGSSLYDEGADKPMLPDSQKPKKGTITKIQGDTKNNFITKVENSLYNLPFNKIAKLVSSNFLEGDFEYGDIFNGVGFSAAYHNLMQQKYGHNYFTGTAPRKYANYKKTNATTELEHPEFLFNDINSKGYKEYEEFLLKKKCLLNYHSWHLDSKGVARHDDANIPFAYYHKFDDWVGSPHGKESSRMYDLKKTTPKFIPGMIIHDKEEEGENIKAHQEFLRTHIGGFSLEQQKKGIGSATLEGQNAYHEAMAKAYEYQKNGDEEKFLEHVGKALEIRHLQRPRIEAEIKSKKDTMIEGARHAPLWSTTGSDPDLPEHDLEFWTGHPWRNKSDKSGVYFHPAFFKKDENGNFVKRTDRNYLEQAAASIEIQLGKIDSLIEKVNALKEYDPAGSVLDIINQDAQSFTLTNSELVRRHASGRESKFLPVHEKLYGPDSSANPPPTTVRGYLNKGGKDWIVLSKGLAQYYHGGDKTLAPILNHVLNTPMVSYSKSKGISSQIKYTKVHELVQAKYNPVIHPNQARLSDLKIGGVNTVQELLKFKEDTANALRDLASRALHNQFIRNHNDEQKFKEDLKAHPELEKYINSDLIFNPNPDNIKVGDIDSNFILETVRQNNAMIEHQHAAQKKMFMAAFNNEELAEELAFAYESWPHHPTVSESFGFNSPSINALMTKEDIKEDLGKEGYNEDKLAKLGFKRDGGEYGTYNFYSPKGELVYRKEKGKIIDDNKKKYAFLDNIIEDFVLPLGLTNRYKRIISANGLANDFVFHPTHEVNLFKDTLFEGVKIKEFYNQKFKSPKTSAPFPKLNENPLIREMNPFIHHEWQGYVSKVPTSNEKPFAVNEKPFAAMWHPDFGKEAKIINDFNDAMRSSTNFDSKKMKRVTINGKEVDFIEDRKTNALYNVLSNFAWRRGLLEIGEQAKSVDHLFAVLLDHSNTSKVFKNQLQKYYDGLADPSKIEDEDLRKEVEAMSEVASCPEMSEKDPVKFAKIYIEIWNKNHSDTPVDPDSEKPPSFLNFSANHRKIMELVWKLANPINYRKIYGHYQPEEELVFLKTRIFEDYKPAGYEPTGYKKEYGFLGNQQFEHRKALVDLLQNKWGGKK